MDAFRTLEHNVLKQMEYFFRRSDAGESSECHSATTYQRERLVTAYPSAASTLPNACLRSHDANFGSKIEPLPPAISTASRTRPEFPGEAGLTRCDPGGSRLQQIPAYPWPATIISRSSYRSPRPGGLHDQHDNLEEAGLFTPHRRVARVQACTSGSCADLDQAALTLTTIEVFSGANEGRGYEYLLLCRTVLELTGGQRWWLSNSASITLLQIFQCLHIVGRTSGWFESPSRQLDDIEAEGSSDSPVAEAGGRPVIGHVLLQAPQTYAPEYTLDISFGISINTLSHLHKVIMLSKVKSSLSPGQGWPSSAQEELARLEKEMFTDRENSCLEASSSRSPSPSLEGVSQYVANEIKEDHMLAFHYSTALFFRRALCDGTGRIVPALYGDMVPREPRGTPLPSGQHLVSKALEHLENIDALAGDLAIANTLWPGFIAAAEAVDWKLRRRALMWFGRAKRHGIGNITKAKALVQEIWRRVDRLMLEDHETHPELGPVDWREVMNDMNMYIMLT